MLNKEEKKQEISNINDSNINQAGGDIVNYYNGQQVKDIISLFGELVSFQISQYADEAKNTAHKRFDKFGQKLTEEVTKKVLDKTYRFNEPSIQFTMQEAALGYIKSGDDKQGEDLIDLLIERIKVDEHTTKQKLIDQAITILPTLSKNCLAILTLLSLRNFTFCGPIIQYKQFLNKMNPMIDIISSVSTLDIAYLRQANCTYELSRLRSYDNFLNIQLKNYDLMFKHPITGQQYDQFLSTFGLTDVGKCIMGLTERNKALLAIFLLNPNLREISWCISCSKILENALKQPACADIANDVERWLSMSESYNKEEVKKFYTDINSNWDKAISILNKKAVCSLDLTPVGKYIASRQIFKSSNFEIGLEMMYK